MNRKHLTLCTTILSILSFSAIASESPREYLIERYLITYPNPSPCPRPVELSSVRVQIQSPLPDPIESPRRPICLH